MLTDEPGAPLSARGHSEDLLSCSGWRMCRRVMLQRLRRLSERMMEMRATLALIASLRFDARLKGARGDTLKPEEPGCIYHPHTCGALVNSCLSLFSPPLLRIPAVRSS